MKVLLVGDVVGKTGRRMLADFVPRIVHDAQIDLVVANGENAAGGNGMTAAVLEELHRVGVHVVTSGNHIFDKKEVLQFIDDTPLLLRPLNLPDKTPGHGIALYSVQNVKVAVINLAGRTFMPVHYDDPFAALERALSQLPSDVHIVLVDFHAEATAEKAALAWAFDGRVSVVVGTHTHVPTADERILPQGTGFLTDLGMTGPLDSIIGVKPALAIEKTRRQMPVRFETAVGIGQFGGLIAEIDETTGHCMQVQRIFAREA
ncbi:MAG: TIGR00282 family metallophosphoesterase [Firmicutes bacterium]|nr:TIGR00282 family metallophosphoesterase [Bacillota bacterium]